MKQFRVPWLLVVLAAVSLAFSFFLTRVYWGSTFPYTHDGANHLARFANYAAALREGQFPPRFAPYIFSGYGFPVFHYNYPLANILSLPFTAIGLNPEDTFAVLATGALAVGVFTVFLGIRRYFSVEVGVVAAVLYATSAYAVTNIFYRGGIGEMLAYALVPLCFVTVDQWHRHRQSVFWIASVFSVSALLLSHNVLALMGVGFLGVWSLSWTLQHGHWKEWLFLWAGGVGLTLWFWLPALAELGLVALSGDALITEAASHALEWPQLFAPWRFGFSRPGPLDSLGFGLGPAALAFLFLGLVFGIQNIQRQKSWFFWRRHGTRTALLVGVVLAVSLFLALSISSNVWLSVPLLSFFQFPWRWLFLMTLATIPVAAWVYQQVPPVGKAVLWAFLLWQIASAHTLRPADRFHYDKDYYLLFPHSTTTRNENRPQTFTLDPLPSWEPRPKIVSGEGEVAIISWLGSKREYTVAVTTDAVIQEPTAYFPGWEVKDSGQNIPLDSVNESGGLVSYSLPAREQPYHIRSGFTGRTPVRLAGEGLSALTLAAVIAYSIRKRRT